MSYLGCIKKVKGVNEDECRMLAKSYLTCRMDRCVIQGRRTLVVVG
jgi:cytochrome c oxidase assembly protein subunit 19